MTRSLYKCILLVPLILYGGLSIAIDRTKIDSLEQALYKEVADTTKAGILRYLVIYYRNVDVDRSLEYCFKELKLVEELSLSEDKKAAEFANTRISATLYAMCISQIKKGNLQEAKSSALRAIHLAEEADNKLQVAIGYLRLSSVFIATAENEKSLESSFRALKLFEILGDSLRIARALNNVGVIFRKQSALDKALKFFERSLQINKKLEYPRDVARSLLNIGVIHRHLHEYDKALEYYKQALQIARELADESETASVLNSIANIYFLTENYNMALDFYLSSLGKREQIGDDLGASRVLANMAATYFELKQYDKAMLMANRSLEISQQAGIMHRGEPVHEILALAFAKTGEYKKALSHYQLFHELYETRYDEAKSKRIVEMETKYEAEKQEQKIALLETNEQLGIVEMSEERVFRNALIGGLFLVLILAFTIYNRFLVKKKANLELEGKNEIIEGQTQKIIMSINYAKRIQKSILVEEAEIQRSFPESFIYYQPLDIVSGDFYWFSQQNERYILAAVDCTGHGVPGAFLSMLGNTLMNEIVNEKKETDPGMILNKLHLGVLEALGQKDKSSQEDGMEISLCMIDRVKGEITFAGAKNSLYVIENNGPRDVQILEGDSFSIGGQVFEGEEGQPRTFKTHKLKIKNEMTLYLITDGYLDQFSEAENDKFSKKRFMNMILGLRKMELSQQKEEIANAMSEWKGKSQQTDDMLIIGVKV